MKVKIRLAIRRSDKQNTAGTCLPASASQPDWSHAARHKCPCIISLVCKKLFAKTHPRQKKKNFTSRKQDKSETLSNSVVTVHPLALLYIGLYSLNTDMLSTCLLSDVFQIEGCLAGLDVGAMVCMLTQGDGWILKGRTGCVRCATHLGTWKMSSISCLVAQLTVMLDKSMPVFFSRPLLSQTFSLTLNQMHVVSFFLRECFSLRKSIVST